MSCFRPSGSVGGLGGAIGYSPYCVPMVIGKTKCVVVNEALRVYYRDQDDSVISGSYSDPARSADGATLSYAMELRTSIRWFMQNPKGLSKVAANLVRLALHCSLPKARIWSEVWSQQSWSARALLIAVAPVGIAVRLRDAWRKRRC